MPRHPAIGLFVLFVTTTCVAASSNPRSRGTPDSNESAKTTIVCKIMESHRSDQPSVALALFHQGDTADRERLAALLKKFSGAKVEFQIGNGAWHPATVVRLRDCFGRGLLVVAAGTASLKDGDEFTLRFPEASK